MQGSVSALEQLGLPASDELARSSERFLDDGQYRLEVPSTEGPRAFYAVLEAAKEFGCPVHRVSQGSGIQMLSDSEIREMARMGAAESIEVCLFVTPRANFDIGALWSAPAGKMVQWQVRGAQQLRYALDDVFRACDLGIRSVLIADLGLMAVVNDLRAGGGLPKNLVVKSSAVMAPANPATCRLFERTGANTINVATDLSVAQLGAIRQAVKSPLDIYVEAPDGLGGFVRHHEVPAIIDAASPIYVKLGLRNAPDIYPSGAHIESVVLALSRERVRRTRLVLDLIEREEPEAKMSPVRAAGPHPADLGVPEI
ncbi:MAG TPA: U32 family peptidase [Polyangiaceae bacterium]|jgi:hypothetical protein